MSLLWFLLNDYSICKERIVVVHVNHNIRKNAGRDEEFVRAFCEENGIEFRCNSVDVPTLCVATGRSVESEAREARRGVFARLKSSGAVDIVLTAHHESDLVESALMHMFRGCGLNGLKGMEIYNPKSGILRPFLYVSKREIDGYIKEKNIDFVTDETNFIDDVDRNFLRLNVIPLIEQRYGGAVKNIAELTKAARIAENIVLKSLNKDYIFDGCDLNKEFKTVNANVDFCDCKGLSGVSIEVFKTLNAADYIFSALKLIGVNCDIESRHINEIERLATLNNGAKIDLPHNLTAAKEYGKIIFSLNKESKVLSEVEFNIESDIINFDGGEVIKESIADFKNLKIEKGDTVIDLDKVPVGAVLRMRRDGDIFKPYGGNEKKLKQYLIDRKIPKRIRDKTLCLCYNKKILVLIGIEISDDIKIDASTKRAVKLSYKKEYTNE